MLFNKTSVDSIAIWQPYLSGAGFVKPIILSTGVGIENFINMDPVPINIIIKPTLNGRTYSQVRTITATGNATFNPSSTALVALREITEYQASNRIDIPGLMIVINANALLMDTYKKVIWSNQYSGANRNKVLSDITLNFTSNPPTAIALGGVVAINNILSGLGIF